MVRQVYLCPLNAPYFERKTLQVNRIEAKNTIPSPPWSIIRFTQTSSIWGLFGSVRVYLLAVLSVVVGGQITVLMKSSAARVQFTSGDVVVKANHRLMWPLENVLISQPYDDSPEFDSLFDLAESCWRNTQRVFCGYSCPKEGAEVELCPFRSRLLIQGIQNLLSNSHRPDERWSLSVVCDFPDESSIGVRINRNQIGQRIEQVRVWREFSNITGQPCSQTVVAGGHLAAHFDNLGLDVKERANADNYTDDSHHRQEQIGPEDSFVETILGRGFDDPYIGLNMLLGFGLEGWAVVLLYRQRSDWRGWVLVCLSLLCFVRLAVSLEHDQAEHRREYRQSFEHGGNVSQGVA